MPDSNKLNGALQRERRNLLRRLENWLETPMIILGFIWLLLLIIELVQGLTPLLQYASTAIWVIFIADFVLRLAVAPHRFDYLKSNWLTVVALVIPALRIFRILRVVRLMRATRTVRGLRLLRLLTSSNRGMRSLRATMRRRGFGYVVVLTVLVTLAGSAGMFAFEKESGLSTYTEALWWTAMIMTTMGSSYWPLTNEGRLLCLFLSIYAFTVFGYTTATLATFFIERDATNKEAKEHGAAELRRLRDEVRSLRNDLLKAQTPRSGL